MDINLMEFIDLSPENASVATFNAVADGTTETLVRPSWGNSQMYFGDVGEVSGYFKHKKGNK